MFILCTISDDPDRGCSLGDVRLTNGSSGRVEICLGTGWGTMSLSVYLDTIARVICHTAGFGGPGKEN